MSEAMRCALDCIEVGVMVPRGGNFEDRQDGSEYETKGGQLAWFLTGIVEVKTARAAVTRLERIEARRWPLAESLRVELQADNFKDELSLFRAGPVYAWEKMTVDSTAEAEPPTGQAEHKSDFRDFWRRAQAVYYGPQWVAYSCDDCVRRAQARFDSPWHPDRPDHILETGYSIAGYRNFEMAEYFNRAQCALLRTSLARYAYEREYGAPPRSLGKLVSAGYLKAVPVDPFSPVRAPLRYKPDGTLWSVGPDAKDDGGKTFTPEAKKQPGQFPSGDLLAGKSLDPRSFYRWWW
ncbi:MAG: hypothetical protein QM758_17350 [Armatimonas sp.]